MQAADDNDPITLESWGKEGKVPQSGEVTTVTGVVPAEDGSRGRAGPGQVNGGCSRGTRSAVAGSTGRAQATPTGQSLAQLAPFPGSQAGRRLKHPVPSYCRFQPQSPSAALGQHPEEELGSCPVPLLGSPALWGLGFLRLLEAPSWNLIACVVSFLYWP